MHIYFTVYLTSHFAYDYFRLNFLLFRLRHFCFVVVSHSNIISLALSTYSCQASPALHRPAGRRQCTLP